MYRTIIFDLGKVIVDFDFQRGLDALAACSGLAPEEIRGKLRDTEIGSRLERGALAGDAFHLELSELLRLEVCYEDFCGIWNDIFLDPLIPESFLEGLKKRYGLVLLSNTNEIHYPVLRERFDQYLRHFDAYILSHEVKAAKPDRQIYEAAVLAAGAPPEQCLFIDDMAENVEGAKRAGLDAVQFTGFERLKADLRERQIEWEP